MDVLYTRLLKKKNNEDTHRASIWEGKRDSEFVYCTLTPGDLGAVPVGDGHEK